MSKWFSGLEPKDFDRNMRSIRIIEAVLCILALLAAPFAAIVPFGLIRDGLWFELLLSESLSYIAVLAYPILFVTATIATSRLLARGRRVAAGVCQTMPVLLFVAFVLVTRVLGVLLGR
jgi:hypothetical protein